MFDALREGLTDDWEVYHSVSLIVRDHGEGAVDDETDFVLCHPDKAVVALEVKGGGLECRYGEWYRPQRNGPSERIPNPFAQALDHRHNLKRKLDAALDGTFDGTLLVHAIAFPDFSVHRLVLASDAPTDIVIDRGALDDIEAAVERVLAYHRGAREKRRPPGSGLADRIRSVLAPRIEIPVTWGTEFVDEQERMIVLTSEQSRLLRRVRRNPRMLVSGCAGSGKTMIAIEQAKRFAREGLRTRFVCFNKGLSEHVATELAGVENVEVSTFHALCTRLANGARIRLPGSEGRTQAFWDETLPEALLEATDKLGPCHDALVVDEVQDFRSDWLDALTFTLEDDNDPTWLFLDANQRIYDADFEVPDGYGTFDLTVNCRNTQTVHQLLLTLYEGDVEPESSGLAGRDPEMIRTDDQAQALVEVLDRLCGEEEIPPQDIVVLSPHGKGSKVRRRYQKIGNVPLIHWHAPAEPAVYFSSIRGFKGLEASVVVLCELEDLPPDSCKQQLYVGLSRARHHVVMLMPDGRAGAVTG